MPVCATTMPFRCRRWTNWWPRYRTVPTFLAHVSPELVSAGAASRSLPLAAPLQSAATSPHKHLLDPDPRLLYLRSARRYRPGCSRADTVRAVIRTCPEIIESTFERVKYRFTTEYLYHMLWWRSMLNPFESGFPQ